MQVKRKSILINNSETIYKNELGEIIDKKTWMKISENKTYLIYDIFQSITGWVQAFSPFDELITTL